MSTPPTQASELAIEVKGCETAILTIQATPVAKEEPTQPSTGLGRVEVSLVEQNPGAQDPSTLDPKPVTTVGSVILRPQNPPSPIIPVAISTSGQGAGTGAANDVPAGHYTLELLPVVYFEVGGAAMGASQKAKVDDMLAILNALGDRGAFSLEINGYTSVEGDKARNDKLSSDRAQEVKKQLEAQLDPKVKGRIYILAEGKGVPPGQQEVDPLDRRVDFVLVPARGT